MIKQLKDSFRASPFIYRLTKPYRLFISQPIARIAKALAWYFNVLRYDYDWDSAHLYPIIAYKLKRVYKALENGVAIQEPKDMQALRIAIKVASRLSKEHYGDRAYRKHAKKWGELKTWTTPAATTTQVSEDLYTLHMMRPNAIHEAQRKQEKEELRELFVLEQKLLARDETILYGILKKYRRHWWE